jgi:hypothetical protein
MNDKLIKAKNAAKRYALPATIAFALGIIVTAVLTRKDDVEWTGYTLNQEQLADLAANANAVLVFAEQHVIIKGKA